MARYYRRRYTRVVKPKKKWASNLARIFIDSSGLDSATIATTRYGNIETLCLNSIQSGTPTPIILKAGNFKVQCDAHIGTSASAVIRTMIYIMYLPEGVYTPSTNTDPSTAYGQNYDRLSDLVDKHPEWILAWKQFGTDIISTSANLERVSFSSRLKRNLNSGDKIAAVILANVDTNQITGSPINRVLVNGTCQFWTCAN